MQSIALTQLHPINEFPLELNIYIKISRNVELQAVNLFAFNPIILPSKHLPGLPWTLYDLKNNLNLSILCMKC